MRRDQQEFLGLNKWNWQKLPVTVLRWLSVILIAKVTLQIVSNYVDYFPPNFQADFLIGRKDHFHGLYRIAFYMHILASPITLLIGLILINNQFLRRFPKVHRTIGKVQVGLVLFFVVPSGIWMSQYAATGIFAGLGFASLSMATGLCTWFGWRRAVNRKFELHRRWMLRSFLLLCAAIFLRLVAGSATTFNWDLPWLYPLSAWLTWIIPLILFETREFVQRKLRFAKRVYGDG